MAKKSPPKIPAKAFPSSTQSETRYWLLKSEPDVFSIDDLAAAKNQTTNWDGVRNYQARNTLRDQMKLDDRVLFYHSNTSPLAIVGVASVVKEGYPDHTALDADSDHYDPKSTRENPIWYMVDIQLEQKFAQPLTLQMLQEVKALEKLELLRRGSRLSVQPVRPAEFAAIMKLASGTS